MQSKYVFYKNEDHPDNNVWEVEEVGTIGKLLFSFDKKKIYNLWTDYPQNFSKEELEIFNKEYPYWREYFKSRFK